MSKGVRGPRIWPRNCRRAGCKRVRSLCMHTLSPDFPRADLSADFFLRVQRNEPIFFL